MFAIAHSLLVFVFVLLYSPWILFSSVNQIPQQYVVYMGASSQTGDGGADGESAYVELLSSVVSSDRIETSWLGHHFKRAFRGFTALLTESEASALSGRDEVVSVFRDPILHLHTTRSWDFLEAQSRILMKADCRLQPDGDDVIIGMIDTGIWPESPSFSDDGVGEIPDKWRGVCMKGSDSLKFSCNRKVIGARFYAGTDPPGTGGEEGSSSRDYLGHGTHTASIAAGAKRINASYGGLAKGTARGGAPAARLAVYKACTENGCVGSVLLKAIDDAIGDGVDIISISIGASGVLESDFLSDPIAVGALHAEQNGVLVVCSGGNDGPDSYTVVNSAPWILTVAASSIDRSFTADVVLGNGKLLQGTAITFSNLSDSTVYPLVSGPAAASFGHSHQASNCYPGSLDEKKVKGKIVVCLDNDPTISRMIKKLVAEDCKAEGLILTSQLERNNPMDSGAFPFVELESIQATELLTYMNNTENPSATILRTIDHSCYKPAPVVAFFSSRGPGLLTENILKPDIMAPGVAILAATVPAKNTDSYAIKSGTSMACPHVTAIAALVKSVHKNWNPSMIKSAIMTTAIAHDNVRNPLTNTFHNWANLHEIGAGESNPLMSDNPGLVFESKFEDHLRFLCYYGYSERIIRFVSRTKFSCPINTSVELISNINYPSISLAKLPSHTVQSVTRTATNVNHPCIYHSKVHAPKGLIVQVQPQVLFFTEKERKLSFRVSFYAENATKGYNFGYLMLLDGSHSVRLVFAVNVQ